MVRQDWSGILDWSLGGDGDFSLQLRDWMSFGFAFCVRGWFVNDDFNVATEGGQQAEEMLYGVFAEVSAQEAR